MKPLTRRCAIYTRKSSEEGLELEFNSLDAQFEACQAYILSQKAEGWVQVKSRYDDGGFSGTLRSERINPAPTPSAKNKIGAVAKLVSSISVISRPPARIITKKARNGVFL